MFQASCRGGEFDDSEFAVQDGLRFGGCDIFDVRDDARHAYQTVVQQGTAPACCMLMAGDVRYPQIRIDSCVLGSGGSLLQEVSPHHSLEQDLGG